MRLLTLIFIIYVATFALYQTSWQNEFVLDDMTKIQENMDLRTPFQFKNFIYPYADTDMHFRNDPSRPLTFILYWACWHVADGKVWPFHVLSTAAHATTAALLAILTLQLGFLFFGERPLLAAAIASGLFITSPLIAGTVIYPFGLSDVLCAMFTLAMLVTLIETQTPSRLRMIVAVIFYYLALSSKQAGFVAPALVVAVDYFSGKAKNPWRMLHIYTPLLSMSLIYLLVRFLYFGGIGDLEGLNETLPSAVYASTQGLMILKYLWHTVAPVGLSIDHQPFPDNLEVWGRAVAWVALAAITGFTIKARWSTSKQFKILAFAWSFFLICLLPTSSMLPTVDLFVERRAYFANLGIFAAAGILLWKLASKQKWRIPVIVVSALAVTAQAAVTVNRATIYGAPDLLWKESLALEPKNSRALINLGVYYSRVERWDESRQTFEELLKIRPDNGAVYSKLAYIYHQPNYAQRNDDLAWKLYQKGLELKPDNIFALYNAGVFLFEKGRNKEAIAYFLNAAKFSPQMTQAWVAAGQAAWNDGDRDTAKKFFSEALAIDPSLVTPRTYLNQ